MQPTYSSNQSVFASGNGPISVNRNSHGNGPPSRAQSRLSSNYSSSGSPAPKVTFVFVCTPNIKTTADADADAAKATHTATTALLMQAPSHVFERSGVALFIVWNSSILAASFPGLTETPCLLSRSFVRSLARFFPPYLPFLSLVSLSRAHRRTMPWPIGAFLFFGTIK